MKDDNYTRQQIIDMYFNKGMPVNVIKAQVNKSLDFINRVIIKHQDFSRK